MDQGTQAESSTTKSNVVIVQPRKCSHRWYNVLIVVLLLAVIFLLVRVGEVAQQRNECMMRLSSLIIKDFIGFWKINRPITTNANDVNKYYLHIDSDVIEIITVDVAGKQTSVFTTSTFDVVVDNSVSIMSDEFRFWVAMDKSFDFKDIREDLKVKNFELTLQMSAVRTMQLYTDKMTRSGTLSMVKSLP